MNLTCGVTGGKPEPELLWERDATTLAGENGTSYTFIAKSEDHGSEIKCTATNSIGMHSIKPRGHNFDRK